MNPATKERMERKAELRTRLIREMYSVAEVAELLSVSHDTVQRMIAAGVLASRNLGFGKRQCRRVPAWVLIDYLCRDDLPPSITTKEKMVNA
jgi:excisionase family DNA binding protein